MFVIKYILEPVQFRIYSNLNSFGVSQISRFESHIIFFPDVHRFAISENAGTFMKKTDGIVHNAKKSFLDFFSNFAGGPFVFFVKHGDVSANMSYWSVS